MTWYLIYTKPSCESLAEANLQRQGYEVYHPRTFQSVRRHGRWHERVVSLFPRYMFLHLTEGNQSLSPVRSSVGVAGIVRFGASFAIVPGAIIATLRQRADPESGLHRLLDGPPLARGAPVHIAMGPFEGLDGVFERAAGADRVLVLLNLLGQAAPVQVPVRFIVPCYAA